MLCSTTNSVSFGPPFRVPKQPKSTADGHSWLDESQKARILIVDDHEIVRSGLAALLETRWDICGEAGDGIEAIEKVRELKPDLVLLDLSMPVMSGTAALKAIRATSRQVKILVLSIHDSEVVVKLAETIGADGFVSKRSSGEHLKEVIAVLLGGE